MRTVGLLICGVGHNPSFPKGIVWCYGQVPPTLSSTLEYQWHPIAVDVPDAIEASVDLWDGSLSTSAIDITVAIPDPLAARYLMSVSDTPVGVPGTDLGITGGATATATTLSVYGGTPDTVVWIGDEAILLGTESLPDQFVGCVRGYYSTRPAPIQFGTMVYPRPQYLQIRETRLIVYDWDQDDLQILQYGYVDDVIPNDDGTKLTIRTHELTGLLGKARLNRGALTWPIEGNVMPMGGALGRMLDASIDPTSGGWEGSRVLTADGQVYLQVDDTIVPASYDVITQNITTLIPPAAIWPRIPDISDEDGAFTGSATELFVVQRSYFPDPRTLSSTIGLPVTAYAHPLGIVYGLCRSGSGDGSVWDAWGSQWGLGIPEGWFDHASIEAEILATQESRVDCLIMGWDGETPTLGEIWDYTGHPFGFIFAPTHEGLISFKKLRGLDILSWGSAPVVNILPPKLKQVPLLDGQFSSVTAVVGMRPWERGQTVAVTSRDGTRLDHARLAIFDRMREISYDFRGINKGGTPVMSGLLGRALQGVQGVNQVTVDVLPQSGVRYDIGSWVRLSASMETDAWVDAVSGDLVPIDPDDPKFAGIITGRRYDIKTGIYRLTLLMANARRSGLARWRAPSAVVVSYTEGAITIGTDFSGVSGEHFVVGDKIDIVGHDGVAISTGITITGVVGNVLSTSAIGMGPWPGNIVRLSVFATYGVGGAPMGAGIRAYVFASTGYGVISGDEPADIYA